MSSELRKRLGLRPRSGTGRAVTAIRRARGKRELQFSESSSSSSEPELEPEEAIFDKEKDQPQQQPKRPRAAAEKDKDELVELDVLEDEDEDAVVVAAAPVVKTTLADVSLAVEINTNFLRALIESEKYLRLAGPGQEKRLAITRDKIQVRCVVVVVVVGVY
jgi:hypothetical protein